MAQLTSGDSDSGGITTGPSAPVGEPLRAPPAPVRPVTDNYHGTWITDPYRYMEDLSAPEVVAWMQAQSDITRDLLSSLPGHAALINEISELAQNANQERVYALQIVNDVYYTLRLRRGAQQPKLYARTGIEGEDRLLIDPENLPGGNSGQLSIMWYRPSPDNRYVAFAVTAAGSEEPLLQVLDVTAGRLLPESTAFTGFEPPDWTTDSRSFFYQFLQPSGPETPTASRFEGVQVRFHRLGRSFMEDAVVLGDGAEANGITLTRREMPHIVTGPGSPYAIAIISPGDERRVRAYAAPVTAAVDGTANWRPIAADYSDDFIGLSDWGELCIALHADTLYWLSFRDAPLGRILGLDLSEPSSQPFTVVEQGALPLSHVYAGFDAIYWRASDAGIFQAYRLPLTIGAQPEKLQLPYPANITTIVTDLQGPAAVLDASSWRRSSQYLAADVRSTACTVSGLQPLGPFDMADDLMVTGVQVPSWDGTPVPLSIVHQKDLRLDGSHPALLFGYGAYGVSMAPSFDPLLRAYYDRGMVLAVCHARGGGELGEAWHRAGFQATKPNTWKDFIACAEYLIANGFTSTKRLAGSGTSAGGILIGRAIQERPELFVAAHALVPVTDLLRMETTENGPPNIREFGSVKTEAGFRALLEMSPYANVIDGTDYPALLVTTGLNDRRVEPWMAAKFVARMQAATASGKPVLLYVARDAGHGFGTSQDDRIGRFADQAAFILWQTGHPEFQP